MIRPSLRHNPPVCDGGPAPATPDRAAAETAGASTFGPALLLVSGRTVGFAVSFFIPVVLVRLLDQTDFGTYKQIFLIAATLYGIGQLGMAESLFYFLPISPRHGARFVVNSVLALILGGLGCLVFLELGGGAVSRWLSNGALVRYAPALGLYLVFMLTSAVLEIVMVSRKRYRFAAGTYVALDILRMGLLVLPVLLTQQLKWLLAGAVAFAALKCAMALWYVRWEFKGALRPDAALLKRQLAYAVPFQLAGIVETLQSNVHQYAVSHYFDAATFAIYSVGCLQIPLVDFVANSVCNVMMVRMAEEIRDGRPQAAARVWRDTTRRLALVFVPLVGLLLVGAHAFIALLFTERYAASVPVFMVSSLAVLLATLQVDGVLRVYAQTRLLAAFNGLRLALVLGLMSWFLTAFHLVGAIAVTVLSIAVMKVLGVLRIRSLMKVRLGEVLPWRSLGAILGVAAAAAWVAVGVNSLIEAPPLVELCGLGLVYATAYLTGLWVFGVLSEDERLTVKGWLARWGMVARNARAGEAGGR
jgi:O-antigen/teichoic acid export membrane protein